MRLFGVISKVCADLEKIQHCAMLDSFQNVVTCGKFNRVATYNYIFSDKWYRKIPSDDLCLRSSSIDSAVDDDTWHTNFTFWYITDCALLFCFPSSILNGKQGLFWWFSRYSKIIATHIIYKITTFELAKNSQIKDSRNI